MKNNMPIKCERCGKNAPNTPYTMSFFNEDWICMSCDVAEKNHPEYIPAKLAEIAACNAGNFNFAGVGCPPELYINQQSAAS